MRTEETMFELKQPVHTLLVIFLFLPIECLIQYSTQFWSNLAVVLKDWAQALFLGKLNKV